MKSLIIAALLGTAFVTTAQAGSVIQDLARTGSTVTVHGFADAR